MQNIAIMGYGVVGSGVARVLAENSQVIRQRTGQEIRVSRILDVRDFPQDPLADLITHDAASIMNDPAIKIVVETIGGAGIAYDLTRQALLSGKHVVTSNKELVARHGPELMQLAHDKGLRYLYEASVGGGIPIIRPLHDCLAANVISQISGILNGTTNYILTRMDEAGIDFAQALAEAQSKGYAEQNPTADLDGLDASRKLAILTSIALGEYIDSRLIHTEGITRITPVDLLYARQLEMKCKLIGSYRLLPDQQAALLVAPRLLEPKHPLAVADGVNNAIMVEGNMLGQALFFGQGAGMLPTASAVLADVIALSQKNGPALPSQPVWRISPEQIVKEHAECQVKALLRINDQLAPAQIERIFSGSGLRAIRPETGGETAWLVGETGNLTEKQLAAKIKELNSAFITRLRVF